MAGDEFGEVGFTERDRKALHVLEADQRNMLEQLRDFRQSLERRMDRLENERAHKKDLERLQEENDNQQKQIAELDKRIVWVYAFAAGAGFVGSIVGVIIGHFWK